MQPIYSSFYKENYHTYNVYILLQNSRVRCARWPRGRSRPNAFRKYFGALENVYGRE